MTTAKQRAWREKFARIYGRKKVSRRRKAGVGVMARGRRGFRRKSGFGGGIQGKAMGGVKLALAALLVGYASNMVPALKNPIVQGGAGLIVPNVGGLPLSQVMVANAVTSVAAPMIGQATSGSGF